MRARPCYFFENRDLTRRINESCLHLSISREEHDWFTEGSLDLLIFKMKKIMKYILQLINSERRKEEKWASEGFDFIFNFWGNCYKLSGSFIFDYF